MYSPPYDRALALASLVRTMRDHFLAVRCGCGAGRVIALSLMGRDPKLGSLTIAHVALRLKCEGCEGGPDEVHLTATHCGLGPAPNPGISLVWTLSLLERKPHPHRRRRHREA